MKRLANVMAIAWLMAVLSLGGWLIVNLDIAGWILVFITVGLMTFELTRRPARKDRMLRGLDPTEGPRERKS